MIEGSKISAVEYIQAKKISKEIRKEFVFLLHNKIDAIITPTTIIAAPRIDEEAIMVNKNVSIDIR